MDETQGKWLLIGVVAIVVVLYLAKSGGGGSTLQNTIDPQAVQLETARLSAASQAFGALTQTVGDLTKAQYSFKAQEDMIATQATVENNRTAAALEGLRLQSETQQNAANQAASASKSRDVFGAIGSVVGGLLHFI